MRYNIKMYAMSMFSVRQVRKDEKKYYEDLLQYSKQHLMVSWLKNNSLCYPMLKCFILHELHTLCLIWMGGFIFIT